MHGSCPPEIWLQRVNYVFQKATMHYITTERFRKDDPSLPLLSAMGRNICQGALPLYTDISYPSSASPSTLLCCFNIPDLF